MSESMRHIRVQSLALALDERREAHRTCLRETPAGGHTPPNLPIMCRRCNVAAQSDEKSAVAERSSVMDSTGNSWRFGHANAASNASL